MDYMYTCTYILNNSYCKSGNFIVDIYYACSFAYEILKCKLVLDKYEEVFKVFNLMRLYCDINKFVG